MFSEKQINTQIIKWLLMPHNVSLAIITAILWVIMVFLPFNANQNFDMLATVLNNIMYFSSICVAGALIAKNADVGEAAVLSVLVALFTIIIIKTLYLSWLGYMILLPITLFRFLLVIKHICLAIIVEKK